MEKSLSVFTKDFKVRPALMEHRCAHLPQVYLKRKLLEFYVCNMTLIVPGPALMGCM
jgi:hypothetical protein